MLAHFGDRPADDGTCAAQAGVRPIVVRPNEWVTVADVRHGLVAAAPAALSAMPKHRRHGPDPLGVLRSSEWWQRSYADLLPAAWASDATPAESADVDLDLHGGGGAGGGDVAMLDATVS